MPPPPECIPTNIDLARIGSAMKLFMPDEVNKLVKEASEAFQKKDS